MSFRKLSYCLLSLVNLSVMNSSLLLTSKDTPFLDVDVLVGLCLGYCGNSMGLSAIEQQ